MSINSFNWMDYAIIIIVALSSIISLLRGFIREALSLTTWCVAFWVAITCTETFSPLLESHIHQKAIRGGVAFFTLFIATLILGSMVNYLVAKLVEKTGLTGTDRLIGVVFGFTRGVLLVAIILLAGSLLSVPPQATWEQSELVPLLKPIETRIAGYLPKNLQDTLGENQLTMQIKPPPVTNDSQEDAT